MTRTEWLIRGLDLLCLLGQGTLLLHFSARLLHRAAGTRDHLIFLAAFCAGQWAAGRVRGVPGLALLAGLLVLYGANRLLLGGRPLPAALAAALGGCIAQCSFGVFDSVGALLLPLIVGGPLILLAAAGAWRPPSPSAGPAAPRRSGWWICARAAGPPCCYPRRCSFAARPSGT